MTIQCSIKSNVKQFRKRMQNHAKQVDYAASRAINDTTAEARKEIIKQVQGKQRSKKAWWNNKVYGIRRKFAHKTRLVGDVHTNIWWAWLQEKGGTKKARNHRMTVPDTAMAKTYRKYGGTRRLLDQKTTFVNKGTIFRRMGGKKSRRVKRLGTLTDTVQIRKPLLSFRATAHRIATTKFEKYFEKRLAEALRMRK